MYQLLISTRRSNRYDKPGYNSDYDGDCTAMDGEMALLKEGGDEGVANEEEKCDEDVELG